MTTCALARLLGVSTSTVHRWLVSGALASTRLANGQRLIALADVARLLEEP